MPKVRVQSSKPSTDLDSSKISTRVGSDIANARIGSDVPSVSTPSFGFQSTTVNNPAVVAGNPIGLLLALTYAAAGVPTSTTTYSSGVKPNVKIKDNQNG